jgi:hypothetical protein
MKTIVSIAFAIAYSTLAFHRAAATEPYAEERIRIDTREAFEADAASVRSGMRPGGKYDYVRPQQQNTVEKKLSEIDALFSQSGSVAGMKEDQKIALFNAREAVDSILTMRDPLVCKKEAPLGSHIPVTTCHTYVR